MTHERKFFCALWLGRITLLLSILFCLFAGYFSIIVDSDIMMSCVFMTVALMQSILFFSTFPMYRMDVRFNQVKKKHYEGTNFVNALPTGASMIKDVGDSVKLTVIVFSGVFIIVNLLLAYRAYTNNKNMIVLSHMIVVIAVSFIFNTLLLIYKIDETFNKLDRFISQLKKDSATEKVEKRLS